MDYNENIPIAGRVNLIPGEDEMSEMYEDGTGHGTAVASVMVFCKASADVEEETESDGFEYEFYPDEEEGEEEGEKADTELSDEDGAELLETDAEEDAEAGADDAGKTEEAMEENSHVIRFGDYVEEHQADFEGINPNMELYSIKVLDDHNEAPVSRVIEGIELARENKIRILNLSFGTDQDDPKLHEAIQKAYAEGMLIIASTANDGKLHYPAAYEEVIAVGSVDDTKTVEGVCEKDPCMELAAPGEGILAVGAFGVETQAAGTSMAAAEVSAIASILWQNNPMADNRLIRKALQCGAWKESEAMPGYGIVDCEKSLELMSSLKEMQKEEPVSEDLEEMAEENKEEAAAAAEIYVSADWGGTNHLKLVKGYKKQLDQYLKVIKIGIRLQDGPLCNLNDKKKFPAWHGFYKHEKKAGEKTSQKCNYVAGYLYLSELAREMNEGSVGTVDDELYYVSDPWIASFDNGGSLHMKCIVTIEGINTNGKMLDKNKEIKKRDHVKLDDTKPSWENILSSELYDPEISASRYVTDGSMVAEPTKKVKSLVVYGMALHTMSDLFAHSSVSASYENGKWKWIGMGAALAKKTTLADQALKEDLDRMNEEREQKKKRKSAVMIISRCEKCGTSWQSRQFEIR